MKPKHDNLTLWKTSCDWLSIYESLDSNGHLSTEGKDKMYELKKRCNCMTKTIKGECGKCGKGKENETEDKQRIIMVR